MPGTTCSTGLVWLVLLHAQPSNMLHSCGSIERPLRSKQTTKVPKVHAKNIYIYIFTYIHAIIRLHVHLLCYMISYYIKNCDTCPHAHHVLADFSGRTDARGCGRGHAFMVCREIKSHERATVTKASWQMASNG